VLEVSVAGVSTKEAGEMVKAWVVLHEGVHVTAEEIIAFCRKRLAAYKLPKYIEFRDFLPKTMVGKVLRRVLVSEDKGST
jgi:long-chain acyl-CoA synthetase